MTSPKLGVSHGFRSIPKQSEGHPIIPGDPDKDLHSSRKYGVHRDDGLIGPGPPTMHLFRPQDSIGSLWGNLVDAFRFVSTFVGPVQIQSTNDRVWIACKFDAAHAVGTSIIRSGWWVVVNYSYILVIRKPTVATFVEYFV